MSKVRVRWTVPSAALAAAVVGVHPAQATIAGPEAARCASGQGPAMLVRVTGFKARTGTVRVQSYGGDPAHYFDKHSYLERVDVKVPAAGPLDVCMAVPKPGAYAISVRHDVDGAGRTGRGDGGGLSGNPQLSLFDLLFRRKPDPSQVSVPVPPRGVRTVAIVLNYLSGTSFRPVAEAAN